MPETHDPDLTLSYFITTAQAVTTTPTTLLWSRTNDIQTYDVLDLSEYQDWVIMLENAAGGTGNSFADVLVFAGAENIAANVTIDLAAEKTTIETACETLAANARGFAYTARSSAIPYHLAQVQADTSDTTVKGWVWTRK